MLGSSVGFSSLPSHPHPLSGVLACAAHDRNRRQRPALVAGNDDQDIGNLACLVAEPDEIARVGKEPIQQIPILAARRRCAGWEFEAVCVYGVGVYEYAPGPGAELVMSAARSGGSPWPPRFRKYAVA